MTPVHYRQPARADDSKTSSAALDAAAQALDTAYPGSCLVSCLHGSFRTLVALVANTHDVGFSKEVKDSDANAFLPVFVAQAVEALEKLPKWTRFSTKHPPAGQAIRVRWKHPWKAAETDIVWDGPGSIDWAHACRPDVWTPL